MSDQYTMTRIDLEKIPSEGPEPVVHKTLRHATLRDIPRILDLAEELAGGINFHGAKLSRVKIQEQLEEFIGKAGKEYLCLVSYDEDPEKVVGVVAAYAFQPIFTTDMMACEVLLLLQPEHRKGRRGLDLLKAFEYWAKLVGCRTLQAGFMIGQSPEEMRRLYPLLGYEESEIIYYKDLSK